MLAEGIGRNFNSQVDLLFPDIHKEYPIFGPFMTYPSAIFSTEEAILITYAIFYFDILSI